ncbi:hypothetical protein RRG08_050799 [Elysia crispata]|uniref:3-ketosteroid-9-alpha-monooxygenase oxygenase component-like C-terminal domain-containing protein n=1 Tax=Elysia crispata TaxID=231223 RepID=A0AAE1CZ17_9GAST|nr:hypothetical protein RRG08_050799 [Elysia crispata]
MVQKVTHDIYVSSYILPPVAKFYMLGEALMVERDIMIWNNKQYVRRPLYVASKEDKLVKKHREWYSQFYSKLDKPLLPIDSAFIEFLRGVVGWLFKTAGFIKRFPKYDTSMSVPSEKERSDLVMSLSDHDSVTNELVV